MPDPTMARPDPMVSRFRQYTDYLGRNPPPPQMLFTLNEVLRNTVDTVILLADQRRGDDAPAPAA
ncbi:MAG: hypothetical protein NTZ05_23505 [Chloroflexi bacterium]|nr:hypothetical protein [Chloroflexota bacterium]